MEGNYPIVCNGKTVGQVLVCRRGLYYHFRGQCVNEKGSVCRLMIRFADVTQKLGIMVPEGEGFSLNKRIPAKYFPEGKPAFLLLSDLDNEEEGIFVPISTEEPFAYLSRLQDAVFENREGIIGAWIPDKS